MNPQEPATKLIERYLAETGRHLPEKTRDDVLQELRGLLHEGLQERARAEGRLPDEEMAVRLVREFGEPETVAERYLPDYGYLIGPKLFPFFLFWARLVLWFVGGVLLFWFVVGLITTPSPRLPEFLRAQTFGTLLGEFIELAFLNLGLLVLVFAAIEWFTRAAAKEQAPEKDGELPDWNPRGLPEVEDPDRVPAAGLVWKVYCIVAFFILFNFFPQYVGVVFFGGGEVRAISVFQMGLHVPIFLLNVWWATALALNMWLLREGRWTYESRWAEFGLGVFGMVIAFLTLAGSSFQGADVESALRQGLSDPERILDAARRGLPWLGRVVYATLVIILLVSAIESAVRLYRLVTRNRHAAEVRST